MAEETKLTTKQSKAIPVMLGARSYEEGCKAAKISKTTFYDWMRDDAFRSEFERRRDQLAETAFLTIVQNIEKASSTLVALLDAHNERVQRLSANDIIRHFLRYKELRELEDRIAAIEARLEAEKRLHRIQG